MIKYLIGALIAVYVLVSSGCQQPEYLPVFPKDPAYCDIAAAPYQAESIDDVNLPYHRPSEYGCIDVNYGEFTKKICGYDCIAFDGVVKCGAVPGMHCLVGTLGYIACGFDCKKSTVNGEAQCGTRYGDRCYQSLQGKIICGLNCHIDEKGNIICEKSPSFRYEFPFASGH